jgi:type I restriction enzyme S subunit
MNKEIKNKLVPQLRFPAFKNDGDWKFEKLGDLFLERQEIGYNDLPLLSLTDKDGIIPQEETKRKNNSSSDKSKYLRVCVGDVAYNTMRMWEGRSAFVNIEGVVSPAYTVCKPNKDNEGLFFAYYFKTQKLIQQFHRYSQGLVKDTLNLKYEAFSQILVPTPLKKEQQKIADCLSSLDQLITIENQQLEVLKSHKKGLLQILFPAMGKTVPVLRFKEFINSPEWDIITLDEITNKIEDKVGDKQLTTVSISAGFGFVSQAEKFSRDISGQQYKNYVVLKEGDFAYNKGNSKKYPQGCVYKLKEFKEAAVPNAFICFRFKENSVADFYQGYFENNFHGKQLQKFITSGARMDGLLNISPVDFFSIILPTPKSKKEQQKIADCLSSLDDLISAQSQKVITLKQHKKGLMQGLFPNIK